MNQNIKGKTTVPVKVKLGVVMDPIQNIRVKHDSTLAMLVEAQKRGWQIYYMEQKDLFVKDTEPLADSKQLKVFYNIDHWFDFTAQKTIKLTDLNIILMRKDPPFDMEYIYTTYILELAEAKGVKVINKPQSLRDANEKLFTALFPRCCPPYIITRSKKLLRDFITEHQKAVLKPLDGMGGKSIFHLNANDQNINVVIETLTNYESKYIMAQRFIPEISQGDKRVLMINDQPIPYALARIPGDGDSRANILAGGSYFTVKLSKHDKWICDQVGPTLKEKGLFFVGLDIIGDYLTEINVTSPGCIREIEEQSGLNVSSMLFDSI